MSEVLITRVGQSVASRAQNRQGVAVVAPASLIPSQVWPGLQGCVSGVFGGAQGRAGVMGNDLQSLLTTDLPC